MYRQSFICLLVAVDIASSVATVTTNLPGDEATLMQVSHIQTTLKPKNVSLLGELKLARDDPVGAASPMQEDAVSITSMMLPLVLVAVAALLLAVLRQFADVLTGIAKYGAEFVGTFVLVFTVGCCVITGSDTWNALAIASVLMVMIYATANISGGHLNPAVSFTLLLAKQIDVVTMFKYWTAQILGGICAGVCYCTILSPNTAQLKPVAPFSFAHAMMAEMIYTFMLCFTVLCVAVAKPNAGNHFFALAIGFVIVAGGYAVGGISGAAFNPAVAIGLDVSSLEDGVGWCVAWAAAELAGGALAAFLFTLVHPGEGSGASAKAISEFIGTFMLVVTVGLNVIMGSTATALSAAAALMCMVYSLGNVSGAHFNPAVTVAVVARGKCGVVEGLGYILTQIVAGSCAGIISSVFHSAGPNSQTTYGLAPGAGFSILQGCATELVFTCVLAYVVLAVATLSESTDYYFRTNNFYGLAIGACVVAGGLTAGALSGGELNPAVSVGISLESTLHHGSTPVPSCMALWAFVLAQLAAGLLASVLFRLTHPKEFARDEGISPYVAEFLGTFVLVFTVGCCVLHGSATWNPIAIASVLMVMIYATGPVSGGNLNPAVSFALGLAGKMSWEKVAKYCVVQLAGGVSAGFAFSALLAPETVPIAAVAPFFLWHSLLAEAIYTFMLCFVVLNCAASQRNNPADDKNNFFALAIGFVIVAGGYAVGGISGAAFNPAVALGLDISSGGVTNGFLWACAELLGACLAVAGFKIVRPEEDGDTKVAESIEVSYLSKITSEFLGVFMLVLTVGLNVVMGSPATAYSAAAALMCMVYSLGNVSGAHFNPAVTVAVWARGKCSIRDSLNYVVVQMIGGVCAGLLVATFHSASANHATRFQLQPGAGYSSTQAGLHEFFFTAVLAYVVLCVATTSKIAAPNFFFALAIGSCVTAGGFAVGAVSGGELNPAVAAGIATADFSLGQFCTFAAFEIAGGFAAAAAFQFTHAEEFTQKSM